LGVLFLTIIVDNSIATTKGVIIQGCNSGAEGVVLVDVAEVEGAPAIVND
jgi:hypothetical protein